MTRMLGSLLLKGNNSEFWVALGCLSRHKALKPHAFIRGLHSDASLVVSDWAYLGKGYESYKQRSWCMPDCELNCLSKIEMIEFQGFTGGQAEIELVRYLLKNAKVMKKMMICACHMNLEEESIVLKKLIRLPRGSENCELVFS